MNDEQAKEAILNCVYNNDERNQFTTDQVANLTGIDINRCRTLCWELIGEQRLFYRSFKAKKQGDFSVVISYTAANELTNKGAYKASKGSERTFKRVVYSSMVVMVMGFSISYAAYREYKTRQTKVEANSTSQHIEMILDQPAGVDTIQTNNNRFASQASMRDSI